MKTSRCPVLNDRSLMEARRKDPRAAAGLDIFNEEPKPEKSLTDLPLILLLSQVGRSTAKTREKMEADIILAGWRREVPGNVVGGGGSRTNWSRAFRLVAPPP